MQGVQNFTHSKSGTVHSLTGPLNADKICFTMTANYNEGDTWTINGVSTSVFFSNHEPLVTGGLITNDTTMATIEDGNIYLVKNRPESNTNLLDNWYFPEPVNQLSKTEYNNANNTYTIDRWKVFSHTGSKLTINNNDSITLFCTPNTGSSWNLVFATGIESDKNLFANKTYTCSVLCKNLILDALPENDPFCACLHGFLGGGFSTKPMDAENEKTAAIHTSKEETFLLTYTSDVDLSISNSPYFGMDVVLHGRTHDASVQLIAAKLEAGNRQTLAHKDANGNWVLNDALPNREVELSKCMRYQISLNSLYRSNAVIGNGIKYSDKVAHIYVPLPCAMKGIPSVIYSGTFELSMVSLDGTYYNYPITNITISDNNCSKRFVNIVVNTNQSIQSHDLNFIANNDSSAQIILNANL